MKDDGRPEEFYPQRILHLQEGLKVLLRRRTLLGWLRLFVVAAAILLTWLAWPSLFTPIPFLFLFLTALRYDLRNRDAIQHQERLLEINRQELRYLGHAFTNHPDGSEFGDPDHAYAEDLDIFGKSSVYQYINRTASEQGRQRMAAWLKVPASAELIISRQKAVRELRSMTEWRQDLQAYGAGSAVRLSTEESIRRWIAEENQFMGKPFWNIARFVLPVCALFVLALYLIDFIHLPAFLFLLVPFMIIAFFISILVTPAYQGLNRVSPALETLAMSTGCIESASFRDPLLFSLQDRCRRGGDRASVRIHRLRRVLDRFDYRMNPLVYIPLSIFLLWDLQVVLQLEGWKSENRQDSGDWFDVLAEIEALSSVGTLSFNHPNWSFPEIDNLVPGINATQLAHPLIEPARAVANDFFTSGEAQITLVTGSNMAGKSTFLRSVGVNMVLACMGAPVCARTMILAPMQVMSSMRIRDNLEESTSTFYAELKKLKSIIDAVNRHEPVFILLDEILRGTNSHDRQAGSIALIRQLIRHRATGIIATHDLELAALEREFVGSLHNYHFDVRVTGTEMYFDYSLRPGICSSMNASLLMQKIGIDFRDQ
jgi:uncharacterized membrane protein YoaK (UPF0700 family)